jgi:hypothetical protein
MGGSLKTHEDKHSIGISFPTFHHIRVLLDSPIEVHGEQGSRTIGKVGVSLILLVRCSIWGAIYEGCSQCEGVDVVVPGITAPYLDPAQDQCVLRVVVETLKEMG